MINRCPSGSNQDYQNCCGPFHNKIQKPHSPEELMRSRYSAFHMGLISYILETEKLPTPNTSEDLKEWCSKTHWMKLEVLNSSISNQSSSKGYVHYKAWFNENNVPRLLEEQSVFEKIKDQWYYTGGKAEFKNQPIENKTPGRNDPCPCGSGKKFKKCCG